MTRSLLLVSILSLTVPPPAVAIQKPSPGSPSIPTTEIACAPRLAPNPADTTPKVTIVGSEDGFQKSHFAVRDTVVVSGGSMSGLDVGQDFFVRRPATRGSYSQPGRPILHTAGWVRIVSVGHAQSLARVVHACTAMRLGDVLEPAVWPDDVVPGPAGIPNYANAGRIHVALDDRTLIPPSEYFVFSVPVIADLHLGQRLTVFRETAAGAALLGEAVVAYVDPETATAIGRLERSLDVVETGDRVAPHQ